MKRHILFIDPLERLNVKKDSSLLLAASMQDQGMAVGVVFETDFYVENQSPVRWKVHTFASSIDPQTFAVTRFELLGPEEWELGAGDTVHMRLDPPFDGRYLRYLWMLELLEQKGIQVLNAPGGIARFNEKMHAYAQRESLPTFVGRSLPRAMDFVQRMRAAGSGALVVKPLDLYQGMGVEKLDLALPEASIESYLQLRIQELQGGAVLQPFVDKVALGEVRALYFKGRELGSILKVPPPGAFLANIAQGASFGPYELPTAIKTECKRIAVELMRHGVDWIAYDLLDGKVSEVNITCPGLLVEVSKAHKRNLAMEIVREL